MRIALAFTAAFAAFAAPLAADSAPPSAKINVADLDLGDHADQKKLEQRIDNAARRMCRTGGFDTEARKLERACRLAAKADAAPKVALAVAEARTKRLVANGLDVQG